MFFSVSADLFRNCSHIPQSVGDTRKHPEGNNGGNHFPLPGKFEIPLDFWACVCVDIAIQTHDQLGEIMQVQAPRGQYRVIGRGRIDTMDFPSEAFLFCKDYESLDEARAWADGLTQLYFWTYVYDDNGQLLHEASSYQEHVETLNQRLSQAHQSELRRKPQ